MLLIYYKYNSALDGMWTMRSICLNCSYHHGYFDLEQNP